MVYAGGEGLSSQRNSAGAGRLMIESCYECLANRHALIVSTTRNRTLPTVHLFVSLGDLIQRILFNHRMHSRSKR
jgi:hypothetical protein